jgi:hypothetical protein
VIHAGVRNELHLSASHRTARRIAGTEQTSRTALLGLLVGCDMWKRHAIGIAAVMALLAQPCAAVAQMSANDVMPGCRELTDGTGKKLVLQGYCRGVVQGLLSFGDLVGICSPNQISIAQAVRLITLYIDQRPARIHEDFTDLALEALHHARPCRR